LNKKIDNLNKNSDESDKNNNSLPNENKMTADTNEDIDDKWFTPVTEHQLVLNQLPSQLKEKFDRIDMDKVVGLDRTNQDFIVRK